MKSHLCNKSVSTRSVFRSRFLKIRAEASFDWKHQPLDVKSVVLKAGNKEVCSKFIPNGVTSQMTSMVMLQ